MSGNCGTLRKTLPLMPAALLLSIAGLSLARPAVAAEVSYDPGDKVYFTYCHSHPPAMRIRSGDSVTTSTRDASNDVFSISDTTVSAKLDLTKVNPQTGPFYIEGSRLGGDVDRARGGQFGRKVQRRLLDLKFLDGALGDVLGGCAHGFIADIETIHFDAGGAAEASTEGNGRETVFGRIKVAAVLDLHTGFELREIEKISSVDGQILNLLAGQNALHGDLLSVDLNVGSLHFHDLTGFSNRQAYAASRGNTDLDVKRKFGALETLWLRRARHNRQESTRPRCRLRRKWW